MLSAIFLIVFCSSYDVIVSDDLHVFRVDHNWTGPTEKKLTGTTTAAGNPWAQGPSVYPVSKPAPSCGIGIFWISMLHLNIFKFF